MDDRLLGRYVLSAGGIDFMVLVTIHAGTQTPQKQAISTLCAIRRAHGRTPQKQSNQHTVRKQARGRTHLEVEGEEVAGHELRDEEERPELLSCTPRRVSSVFFFVFVFVFGMVGTW